MTDQFSVKKILKGLEGRLGEDDYLEPLRYLLTLLIKINLINLVNLHSNISLRKDLKQELYYIPHLKKRNL